MSNIDMVNRRRSERVPTRIEVLVTLLEERSASTVSATIGDISEGGLQVEMDHPLRLDAPLRMDADEVTLYGRVRYCCPRHGRYVIGVSGEGIQIHGNELTCSVQDLLAYWNAGLVSFDVA